MKNRIISYLTTTIVILLLPIQTAYLQEYKIEATITGVKDTSLILSYRYGTKFYSIDTARTDSQGYALFTDTIELERGMYQVVLPDKSFIDFFIDEEQYIDLHTVYGSLVDSLHSNNSASNEIFFIWQAKNQGLRMRAQTIQKKAESISKNSPEFEAYQQELAQLREENKNLWDNTIIELNDKLQGKFLKGMRPFIVPDDISIGTDGKIDQKVQYEYYKTHFFDSIDFTDAALIRTPLIHSKLEQFFSRVVPAIPDSVQVYAEKLIELSLSEPEMFQYTVQFLLNFYSDPKIMGMDAVYVYIAENYYLNGKASWVDEANLKFIRNRVKVLKPLLIGKQAPDLIGLETPEGERIDIKDLEAKFTVLYFWEPDCGFCKTTTPKLKKVYHQFRDKDLVVVAVNTRIDKEPWLEFIVEHELDWINVFAPNDVRDVLTNYEAFSTPKLFILDQEKKIVAKDIAVDQAAQLLQYLFEGR